MSAAPVPAHIAYFRCILLHGGVLPFCLSLHYTPASALCILCIHLFQLTVCVVVVGVYCIRFVCMPTTLPSSYPPQCLKKV